MGCYICYSEEKTTRGRSPPRPLLAVPNVTANPPTASVPVLYFIMAPPRRGGGGALGGHRVRPSVCLSDVAYIGSNSKTKRPRKTKLCTGVPQFTCDSHTDFKVKRSKVNVTGRGHIVAAIAAQLVCIQVQVHVHVLQSQLASTIGRL